MKIRTSFVTNSSGSSSSRIMIENQVLCDILKKYTDEINLRLRQLGNVGVEIVSFENGTIQDSGYSGDCYPEEEFWWWNYNTSPAFNEIPDAYIKNFREKVEQKISKPDEFINQIFDELEHELKEKEKLINDSYTKLTTTSDYSGDGGSDDNLRIYDKRNKCPNCGNVLVYTKYIGDNYCDTKEIDERITCSNETCNYNKIIQEETITGKDYENHFSDEDIEEFDEYLPFKEVEDEFRYMTDECFEYFDTDTNSPITDSDLPF